MSLIHELRASEIIAEPKELTPYEPVFMGIIARKGYYLISEKSLFDEKTQCRYKEGIDFITWLKNNKLKIKELDNGYSKIYY